MSIARLPDVDLYYETHGEGTPVVFIHGAGGSHASWWLQASALLKDHRVILYDQRGFGGSRPAGDYDPGDAPALTRDLAGLLDHLRLAERVVLVGHSLGTLAALDLAEAHPGRVAGLVLSSAHGGLATPPLVAATEAKAKLFAGPPPPPPANPTPRSADEVEPFGMVEMAFGPFGPKTRETRPDLVFLYGLMAAAAKGPTRAEIAPVFATARTIGPEEARAMTLPVLVIGGADDPVFTPDLLAEAAKAFPNARFVRIEDAGHSAYFEQHEAFNAELKRLLEEAQA